MKEESGLDVVTMKKVGYIEYQYKNDLEKINECHIFIVDNFYGELKESNEIKPQWFELNNRLPYEKMWKDYEKWLPIFLSDKTFFKAYFLFNEDQENIDSFQIEEISDI